MAGLTLSAFDVIGPVMVGPSSSHTAGAARLGRAARQLLDDVPTAVHFGLHGSFAATGKGHATDRALLAGVLGDAPDSEDLPKSFERALSLGLGFTFAAIDLGEEAHPNSVQIRLTAAFRTVEMAGASLGGGMIQIERIDSYAVALSGHRTTLICWHQDQPGFLADVTSLFAEYTVNIASITTTRSFRGGPALTAIEADDALPTALPICARLLPSMDRLCVFAPLP
jgi:L-serine dehydratase